MTKKQQTELDQWRRIGEQTKVAEDEFYDVVQEIFNEGEVPKSGRNGEIRRNIEKIEDGFTDLKHHLEERLVDEHEHLLENDDFMDIFYGGLYNDK